MFHCAYNALTFDALRYFFILTLELNVLRQTDHMIDI